jgi:post-segregation antitoxin (ccd killing protein)
MKNKRARLSIFIGEELDKEITKYRKKYVLNISEICRKAIEEELEKLKKNTSWPNIFFKEKV